MGKIVGVILRLEESWNIKQGIFPQNFEGRKYFKECLGIPWDKKNFKNSINSYT